MKFELIRQGIDNTLDSNDEINKFYLYIYEIFTFS